MIFVCMRVWRTTPVFDMLLRKEARSTEWWCSPLYSVSCETRPRARTPNRCMSSKHLMRSQLLKEAARCRDETRSGSKMNPTPTRTSRREGKSGILGMRGTPSGTSRGSCGLPGWRRGGDPCGKRGRLLCGRRPRSVRAREARTDSHPWATGPPNSCKVTRTRPSAS